MHLARITPSSPEWFALAEKGGSDFLGSKADAELWAIVTKSPIGILGFEVIAMGVVEVHLWVEPAVRGRWWTRGFYEMLKGIGFSKASTIVAGVGEASESENLVQRLGWQKYCQQDDLSYYQIQREDVMRDQPVQA